MVVVGAVVVTAEAVDVDVTDGVVDIVVVVNEGTAGGVVVDAVVVDVVVAEGVVVVVVAVVGGVTGGTIIPPPPVLGAV